MVHKLSLPLEIMSPGDVSRLNRELGVIDNYIQQAKLRQPGTPLQHLPRMTRGLNSFTEANKLNLLLSNDRTAGLAFLEQLMNKGKVVHVSFVTDPSITFLSKLTAWFRDNIDPLIQISVGLEPTIAAGCIVRTDNRLHDFSLRKHFDAQRPLLLAKIKEQPIQQ